MRVPVSSGHRIARFGLNPEMKVAPGLKIFLPAWPHFIFVATNLLKSNRQNAGVITKLKLKNNAIDSRYNK